METSTQLDKIESRLDKLEGFATDTRERLAKIETRLDHIETNMVTKEDLARLMATMVKWMVGMFFGSGVAAITVMTFVLNNAVPKVPPTAATPIVIQLPAYK